MNPPIPVKCVGSFLIASPLVMMGLCLTEDLRSLRSFQKQARTNNSAQLGDAGRGGAVQLGPIGLAEVVPADCPNPPRLERFREYIAFQRAEEINPLREISVLHAMVWEQNTLTVFYVSDERPDTGRDVRMAYVFGKDGLVGGGSCSTKQDWKACASASAGTQGANYVARTCAITIDLSSLPRWAPSPDNDVKQGVAAELRKEIQAKWAGVQRIVVRDFNLSDPQITMLLRIGDRDYYQGCGFDGAHQPHCVGWHSFGQVSTVNLRRWILEKPYTLK